MNRSDIEIAAPIDGDALRHALTGLARSEPDKQRLQRAALELLKMGHRNARAALQSRFEAGAISGVHAARAHSDTQDTFVQVLYDLVSKHFYYAQNPTEAERIAIVATGGYGRRELAPQSDIDLLFVRPYKQTPWGESTIEFILRMLWDMGLKVGHATRSLDECIRLAKQDITVATAILDARFIWGDAKLYRELRRRFRGEAAAGDQSRFLAAKLAERDERHFRQGASRYLVEPNVKNGKGGLRDLQTLYWIGKYLYAVDAPEELIAHQVFGAEEFARFREAEAFLWDVRFHLHYAAGRAEERLSFDLQPEIARRFTGSDSRPAVESFMRRYFLAAKEVGDLTRIFCAALEEQNKKPKPALSNLLPRLLKRRWADEPFFVDNGRLNARAGAFERDPVNLLRLFQRAGERALDIHPAALREITRSLHLIGDELRGDPEANAAFISILTARDDPERQLRLLNESGVFGRFVPEFGRVVGLMQFNMYHHYTVDEHSIRAIGHLAAIERGELKNEHPLATEAMREVSARNALYIAVLLHDIAKGLPGDHSEAGAAIAERLCARWTVSAADAAAAVWLVRNHLVMSDTAQRRDIGDPKTVRDFSEKVRSPELLRMLLALTVADIRAVGPGVWNGWKGQLLRQLYRETIAFLSGSERQDRSAIVLRAKEIVGERLRVLAPGARERALARHADAYWPTFQTETLLEHAMLLERLKSGGEPLMLSAKTDAFHSVTEITVVTPDRPGLFARLAGAITAAGGSIVDGKIFTTQDGIALDVFSVQDAHGAPFGDPERLDRLRRAMLRALKGDAVRPRAPFRGRRRASAFRIPTRVRFDNAASTSATVIEVEAADRPGLLFDLTLALAECGLSVASAVIATYGERAVDVFYVTDSTGRRISDPEALLTIETHLAERANAAELEGASA